MGLFIGIYFEFICSEFSGEVWSSSNKEPQKLRWTSIVERLVVGTRGMVSKPPGTEIMRNIEDKTEIHTEINGDFFGSWQGTL